MVEVGCSRHMTREGLRASAGVDLDRLGSVVVEPSMVSIFLRGRSRRGLTVDGGVELEQRVGWLQIEMPTCAGVTEVNLVRRDTRYQFIASP